MQPFENNLADPAQRLDELLDSEMIRHVHLRTGGKRLRRPMRDRVPHGGSLRPAKEVGVGIFMNTVKGSCATDILCAKPARRSHETDDETGTEPRCKRRDRRGNSCDDELKLVGPVGQQLVTLIEEDVMKHFVMAAIMAAGFALAACPADARMPPVPGTVANHPKSHGAIDRASMQTMQIPSHGALMNALVYIAAGSGLHPVVILLHGFPGNERNLDLAQDMRRAGWDVLYFNYRGSWGTLGNFSFAHSIEDTAAAIAYLRQPEVARSLRVDPGRIVLIGHSMGGFMTVEAAAADPAIKAFATISAADMSGRMQAMIGKEPRSTAVAAMASGLADEGMAPLAGCTPTGLANELADHVADWPFPGKVDALKNRNALIVTSDDGLANDNQAFAAALRRSGDSHVTTVHLPTDHAYSDQRLELSRAVLHWLATLPGQRPQPGSGR
jgi:pimeloyl-ACP methyl ester carboxylesterase